MNGISESFFLFLFYTLYSLLKTCLFKKGASSSDTILVMSILGNKISCIITAIHYKRRPINKKIGKKYLTEQKQFSNTIVKCSHL